jgi:hypothetical protein
MRSLFAALALLATPALAETQTIELPQGAELVVLDVQTSYAHSCPGHLDLVLDYKGPAAYAVAYDTKVADYVSLIKNNVSPAAKKEIEKFELQLASGPICLSFGHSWGRLYVHVEGNETGAVTIELPETLEIREATVLRK